MTSFVKARTERFASYYDGDNYIQHNPNIIDGLSGFAAALKAMAGAGSP